MSIGEVIEAVIIAILALILMFYLGAECAIHTAKPEVIDEAIEVEYFGFSSHLYE